jgi:copper chaperone CopZ
MHGRMIVLIGVVALLTGCDPGTVEEHEMTTTTIEVQGMTCEGCEGAVRTAVLRLPGVQECTPSHVEQKAIVTYDGALVQLDTILETITRLGYEARRPE